jgi:hypothetical protein
MKCSGWFTRAAVALALGGIMLPQLATADFPAEHATVQPVVRPVPAPAPPAAPSIADVALAEGGVLNGQVLDAQGQPMPQTNVVLQQNERLVASAVTDTQGRFTVGGLNGGLFLIAAGSATVAYRLWAPHTAPPAARSGALVVSGEQVVRGQGRTGGLRYWLTNPWILAGLIGAAIVVPIALTDSDKVSTS